LPATYVTEAELRANLQLGNLYSSATVEEVCQAAENVIKSYLWFNDYNVIARECTTTLATIYTDTIHDIQIGQVVTVENVATLMVATEIWQAKQAANGGALDPNFQPSPFKMGSTLIAKVRGLIANHLAPNGLIG